MLNFCVLDAKQDLQKGEFDYLLSIVSPQKRERIEKYSKYRPAQNSLLGDILARKMIAKVTGIPLEQQIFSLNSHGKPFLENDKNIYHNISHSGSWIVCAVSDQPVGVDVQEMHPINNAIAKRFFSGDEYEYIMEAPKEESQARFYRIWSMKESYIKQKGLGMSSSLGPFSVLEMLKSSEIKFYQQIIHPTVACHICTICSLDDFNRADLSVCDILSAE